MLTVQDVPKMMLFMLKISAISEIFRMKFCTVGQTLLRHSMFKINTLIKISRNI